MKNFPEKLSVQWLSQAYEKEELTPEEVMKEIIIRARKYEEKNIWIIAPSEELINPYIRNLPKNRKEYPLWGIPFAIKDNIDLKDIPTTAACPEYKYTPKKSAYVVEKLIDAGAIPIGKTNLDQFATGLVGTRSPYGEVHNAYNDELISGGSSSGSAVSVALGIASFALGTDTAGSGRVPAMLNGLVGYKPPIGSWSTTGVVPACVSLDCVTVFTSSLEEAKQVDAIARGIDDDCIWSREIFKNPTRLPEKILLPKDEQIFFGEFAQIYKEKWEHAIKRIENTGIQIEYISYEMFQKAAAILYEGAYVAERWEALGGFVEGHMGATLPITEQILRSGDKEQNTARKLFENLHELQMYRHETNKLLKNAVLIMPTAGGTFTRAEVRDNPIETNSQMGIYTNHCNLLDLFAVAIPENLKDVNLPFGITVFGLYNAEDIVLGMCEKFLNEVMKIAVCGLHKKGMKLECQLTELGGVFLEHTTTAKEYRLYALDTMPVKPGLVRSLEEGECIEVDVFTLPKRNLASFMENITSPLNIGDVKLIDESYIKGFLCEEYVLKSAKDITQLKKFE